MIPEEIEKKAEKIAREEFPHDEFRQQIIKIVFKKGVDFVLTENVKEVDKLKKQNENLQKEKDIYKKILEDVFEKHGELCSLCEKKGRCLPECYCMTTEECLDTLYILYEKE